MTLKVNEHGSLKWYEIGNDSDTIIRIAHSGQDLFVEFKPGGSGYKYYNVSSKILQRILKKECIRQSDGKPSYGATLNKLVLTAGYEFDQYK